VLSRRGVNLGRVPEAANPHVHPRRQRNPRIGRNRQTGGARFGHLRHASPRTSRSRPSHTRSFAPRRGTDGQPNIAKDAAAAISRLIATYESGGVIAVIVPRHAFVDRRKSNGDGRDEGYAVSLQQQAGLAAVAALNGYRDRLAKALREDGPVPEFDADLAALARAQGRVGFAGALAAIN
jgi:hypothetical protein